MAELASTPLRRAQAPAPDYVASLGTRTLGVEITSLHAGSGAGGSQEVRNRAATNEFFALVQDEVRRRQANCLLSITLFGDVTQGQRRARELATEVVALISEALTTRAEYSSGRLLRNHGLPAEVVRLNVTWKVPRKSPMVLLTGPAYLERNDFGAQIEAVVAAKEQRLGTYRQHCDVCWLAIVLPFYYEVLDAAERTPVLERQYASAFDRVLLVDYELDRVWELPLGLFGPESTT